MKWILMYSKLKFICVCFLFILAVSNGYAIDKKQSPPPVDELQILIDVSGSMKHNDPHNLRIPAVKLLVNLLPHGTKAGIWLFAENTKVLVETGVVNAQWKKKALSRIRKIHSAGLFTNIEDAIQNAAQPWFASSEQQNRNLILLTDGMVDVSKDIMQSAESRERIMVEQVSLLQQAGVKVQAIALSSHADVGLLNKLAFNTNGWSEMAESADQLQKVFFKMFKKALPQDSVPIKGNMFAIDKAINEFSVLIFKDQGALETQLIAPDNSKIVSSVKTKNVAWLSEVQYDLITIKKPKAGNWRIVAKMDPDNQVMIVTDLKLQVDDFPSHIAEKESLELMAYFTDQQQLISRDDFLSLINISIEQTDSRGAKKVWKMNSVEDKQGLFSQRVGETFGKGKHTIKIIADGKTFKREKVQTIQVVDSPIKIETEVNQELREVKLKLVADQKVINTEMMAVQVVISQIGIADENQAMEKTADGWELVVAAPELGASKVINFSVMAKTLKGDSISPDIKPFMIEESLFFKDDELLDIAVEEVKQEDESKDEVPEDEEVLPIEEEEPVNWGIVSAIVGGVNIIFIVAGFFLFKFLKKKKIEEQAQLLGRLG